MGLDEALKSVGQLGPYQVLHFCMLTSLATMPHVWNAIGVVYQGEPCHQLTK